MIRLFAVSLIFVATLGFAGDGRADLRGDLDQCARIADDPARLACFDAIALPTGSGKDTALDPAERRDLEAALRHEFRFDPGLKTGDLGFRIGVSGNLQISRSTAAAREVERLVRRIATAFGDFNGWGVAVTVHGASVALSRGHPYSGEELAQQAEAGLQRTGLDAGRYTVTIGPPAQPRLWDDGRIRDANEHIDVAITGLD
jgi:hypothetical protein